MSGSLQYRVQQRRRNTPLKPRYGKLLVLSEEVAYGRRIATVRCDCGKEKEVQAASLIHGNVSSCGAPACRGVKVEADRNYHPTGTTALSLKSLRKLYEQWTHPTSPKTGEELAEKSSVNKNTLYSAFRAIQKCGDFDTYERLVLQRRSKRIARAQGRW